MSGDSNARGFSGLTRWQIVKQSFLCHPDWDVRVHCAYLANEEGVPTDPKLVERWLEEHRTTAAIQADLA